MQTTLSGTNNSISHKLNNLPDLLSVTQVAAVLNVHRLSVRRYIKTGVLQGLRVGGVWRIQKTDLLAFLNFSTADHRSAEAGVVALPLAAAGGE